ncbi:hypothetical protein D030_3383A, partial [Vibrio parahaemolyticus AQ3810]|jgi:hypothetical protein
MPV